MKATNSNYVPDATLKNHLREVLTWVQNGIANPAG
jgi:hypothetical protein